MIETNSILNKIPELFLPRLLDKLNLHIEGEENIAMLASHLQHNGSLLVTANHLATIDFLLLTAIIRRHLEGSIKRFAVPAARNVNQDYSHIIGSILTGVEIYPVIPHWGEKKGLRAGAINLNTLRNLRKVLKEEGGVVGIFPEGQRSSTGSLMKAQKGTRMLLSQSSPTSIAVLPLAFSRTHNLNPRNLHLHLNELVTINIGTPKLATDILKEALYTDVTAEDICMLQIANLLPEEQKGHYLL